MERTTMHDRCGDPVTVGTTLGEDGVRLQIKDGPPAMFNPDDARALAAELARYADMVDG